MTAYTYTALTTAGKEKKGILESDSPKQIRQQLRSDGLIPLKVVEIIANANKNKIKRHKKISIKELSLITRQLATLISADMPIEQALQAAVEQNEKTNIKSVLMGVRSKVLEGHSLASGIAAFPNVFPQIYQATIEAGEESGYLDKILIRLAEFTEKQQQTRQKILQAMIYPSIMTVIALSIVTFLLIYIVPHIINVFNQTGQQLPFVTIVLLSLSDAVKSYGIYGIIIIAALIFLFLRLLKRHNFRFRFHKLLLKIPVLGNTLKVINTARFSRTFGVLSAATVPVLNAMHASNKLVNILPIKAALDNAIINVREGMNISKALKQTKYFPALSIHLIATGEASGQLESMLTKAADDQEQEVSLLIDNCLTLFEPALILIMGAIVLFIVLAILLPIFSLDQFAG